MEEWRGEDGVMERWRLTPGFAVLWGHSWYVAHERMAVRWLALSAQYVSGGTSKVASLCAAILQEEEQW